MTTHYQKIQALGNRMAENLTIMGVPSQFDEGGLTLADKILQIQHFTNGVLLFADKLIEQSSNTIKFTALVLKDGVAQAGKTVHFKGLYSNKITITHDSSNVDLGENGWIITLTGGRVRIGGIATGINIVKRSSGYYIGINSESSTPNLTGDYVYYDGSTKTLYSNNDSLDISNWTGVDSIDFTNLYDTSETWGTVGGVVELPLYATTDSAGVATVTYTCSGAGKIPVVARCGSVVSEIYDVIDCLYLDLTTSDTHTNYTKINADLTFDTDKLVLTRTADGECYANYSGTVADYKGKTIKFECEIDSPVIAHTRIYQQVNGSYSSVTSNYGTTGTFTATSEINANATSILFRIMGNNLNSNQGLSFKNIKIYPI